jgi:hypothetical protein
VQESASVFNGKMIFLIGLGLLSGCSDIPRDNLLDPKNKNSLRPQIVAVDVFVNTSNDLQYNQYMLSALDQLQQKYTGQINIAEYHRNTTDYTDPLTLPENEILYNIYITPFTTQGKGVPDVFLNGTAERIQGASSLAAAVIRVEQALQPLLLQNSFFTIESEINRNDDQADITVKLARLGSTDAHDLLLKTILTEQIDNQSLKRVTRRILKSDIITDLSAGEIKTIEFHLTDLADTSSYNVLLNVSSADELNIYQSVEMSLQ